MKPSLPYFESRPWGDFIQFTNNTPSTVKIITIKPGEITSLQRHQKRDEVWHIISGQGTVWIGEHKQSVSDQKDFFVPKNVLHRLEGGQEPLVVLEISLGIFEENDVERLEDKYGR